MDLFVIRQPGQKDQSFPSRTAAVEFLVAHPGYAKLYCNGELMMTKGIPPHSGDHNRQVFRGLLAEAR